MEQRWRHKIQNWLDLTLLSPLIYNKLCLSLVMWSCRLRCSSCSWVGSRYHLNHAIYKNIFLHNYWIITIIHICHWHLSFPCLLWCCHSLEMLVNAIEWFTFTCNTMRICESPLHKIIPLSNDQDQTCLAGAGCGMFKYLYSRCGPWWMVSLGSTLTFWWCLNPGPTVLLLIKPSHNHKS